MATARPTQPAKARPTSEPPSPGRRAAAIALDVVYGGLASLLAGFVAGAWLLTRTGWGRDDAGPGDATFAAGLLFAATPSWLAWTVLRLLRDGATPGQARCGLRVTGRARRRLARLACHPLAAPGWLWLAALAVTAKVEAVAVSAALTALMVALGGLLSAGRILLRPDSRALHDLAAGTRLVSARDK